MPRVNTVYRISLDRYGVNLVGGGTCRLRVVAPNGGGEVTGTTTMPLIPELPSDTLIPRAFTRERDTLALTWPLVADTNAYELNVSSEEETYLVFATSTISLPGTLTFGSHTVFHPGLLHKVIISAVDANYYDFYRRESDFLTGTGLINRLVGGVGVFGSISRVQTLLLDVR